MRLRQCRTHAAHLSAPFRCQSARLSGAVPINSVHLNSAIERAAERPLNILGAHGALPSRCQTTHPKAPSMFNCFLRRRQWCQLFCRDCPNERVVKSTDTGGFPGRMRRYHYHNRGMVMSRAASRTAQSWCASVQEGRPLERYFAGNLSAGALYAWLEDCQELTFCRRRKSHS